MNRFGDISGHIKRNLIVQPLREILADLFHGFLYPPGNFHGIGTRQHINAKYGSILTIDATLRTIGRGL